MRYGHIHKDLDIVLMRIGVKNLNIFLCVTDNRALQIKSLFVVILKN